MPGAPPIFGSGRPNAERPKCALRAGHACDLESNWKGEATCRPEGNRGRIPKPGDVRKGEPRRRLEQIRSCKVRLEIQDEHSGLRRVLTRVPAVAQFRDGSTKQSYPEVCQAAKLRRRIAKAGFTIDLAMRDFVVLEVV